jgi:hypothetical protein
MAWAAIACASHSLAIAQRVELDSAAIVVDASSPSYVAYAVKDLADYLQSAAGAAPNTLTSDNGAAKQVIAVGAIAAESFLGKLPACEDLGEEGYRLKSVAKDGRKAVLAYGTTPRGTKAALADLMKRIEVEGTTPFIDGPLDITSKPSFATRGMHFNGWPFGYPHSFRGWSEDDWQRYLDILAYQHVNLFFFWPFIEIMPVPLSAEDAAYLTECRRIIDYAHDRHGMQVWIMHCTNRVAQDRCGVSDPKKRPYWRPSQKDLNPADLEDFKAIMASRAALYAALNNADGFCNIDSDPGYWVGSTVDDYVHVMKGYRELLDRHTLGGKKTKLIDWMWVGWGIRHTPGLRSEDRQDETIQLLKRELAEPWGLASGDTSYLPLCRRHGVLEKTILLQYGMIEHEPAYPHTNVNIDAAMSEAIAEAFMKIPDLPGVMGNMQTPLLQFPHMYYFTSCAWDVVNQRKTQKEAVTEVARLLYPDQRQLIAECYLALNETEPSRIGSLVVRLEEVLNQKRLGRLGLFGRKLFPDGQFVAESILYQLKLRGSTERLMTASSSTSPSECADLIARCLDDSIAWGNANGWPDLWGARKNPLESIASHPRYGDLPFQLALALQNQPGIDQCFTVVEQTLSKKYPPQLVQQRGLLRLKELVSAAARDLALSASAEASSSTAAPEQAAAAAIDGRYSTKYTPANSQQPNAEWLQLTWKEPQTVSRVVGRFSPHASIGGRSVRLQRESAAGEWEDLAQAKISFTAPNPFALATFTLANSAQLEKLRIVNLSDVCEVEVY